MQETENNKGNKIIQARSDAWTTEESSILTC